MENKTTLLPEQPHTAVDEAGGATGGVVAGSFLRRATMIERTGRAVALAGVVLPLLLIGGLKFTRYEVEGSSR